MTRRLLGAALLAVLAGLLGHGAARAAKPPDLPRNETIFVTPQLQPAQPTAPFIAQPDFDPALAHAVLSSVLFTVHPFLALVPVRELLPAPAETGGQLKEVLVQVTEMPDGSVRVGCNFNEPPCQASQPSSCPHMQQQSACDRHIRVFADPGLTDGVLDNLRKLELAASVLQSGRELAREGSIDEALECMEFVRVLCPGSSFQTRAWEVLAEVMAYCDQAAGAEEAQEEPEDEASYLWLDEVDWEWTAKREDEREPACTGRFTGCGPDAPITLHCTNTPLCTLLDDLRACQGVRIVVDSAAIEAKGIPLCQPVSIHVEDVPVCAALRMVLEPMGLVCVWHNGMALITTAEYAAMGQPEAPVQEKPVCPAPCPRAQAMHARHKLAGVREQVRGLMKACHLALAEGRHDKAADLAREAHALDPETVEADPVVYKLHLLTEMATREQTAGGRSQLCPHLPPMDGRVPADLDALMVGDTDTSAPGTVEGQEPKKEETEQAGENGSLSLGLGPWPVLCWKDRAGKTCAEVYCGPHGVRLSCPVSIAGTTWHVLIDRGACFLWLEPAE
jgi:hypothetical protein